MLAENLNVTAVLALIRNSNLPEILFPSVVLSKQYYLLSYEPSIRAYYILYIVANQATNTIFAPVY